jgi:hypothetical protein
MRFVPVPGTGTSVRSRPDISGGGYASGSVAALVFGRISAESALGRS